MMSGNAEISVPPGFRFHPTDEELLYYYLRKKVSYEAIDLDVIREVDLNKLEPWDLKDKCRIGSGPQNEWYFFSHKDKKYPTGTRTNRATIAGFWKATGRDKAIHHTNSKRIGMRKTLVFYTGRAPHGHKTDWIMHEYRLHDDDDNSRSDIQEDGWVVCRVFKKKNHFNNTNIRGFGQEVSDHHHHHQDEEHVFDQDHNHDHHHMIKGSGSSAPLLPVLDLHYSKQNNSFHNQYHHHQYEHYTCLDHGSMHLPQLFSPESAAGIAPPPLAAHHIVPTELECSQNLLRLTSTANGQQEHDKLSNGDWSFLDKLLTSSAQAQAHQHVHGAGTSTQNKFAFQYLGYETDVLKFPK